MEKLKDFKNKVNNELFILDFNELLQIKGGGEDREDILIRE